MSDAASPANSDFEEQRARIRRALDESDKFSAEQKKLLAEQAKLVAEQAKLATEQTKLAAEGLKLQRDRLLAPWQIVVSSMAAGAAFFGAGVAFIKLIGP